MKRAFDTLLIANRGEIAVRIARTAKALGLRTVAVYSQADEEAPHVRAADVAYPIGPVPGAESYLSMDRILAAAAATGADSVHPGYGFLSENADFAAACEARGLVFVGPPAKAIELMGNKARAKRLMLEADVPCVPGYQGDDQSDAALTRAAGAAGFPVMVKAAAGGGGLGLREVARPEALPDALAAARSEAGSAFGSEELIIEKAVVGARHVEIQVFADAHGNVVHLGERDCSVQRRKQKVLEEAPCPVMTPPLREAMGDAACRAARAVDYRGAGTVEFLLDGETFYFLEMNTRLQVEHPVTEMVTGLDLVAWQLAVAGGEPLPLAQADITLTGHAIEVRLYAEQPALEFRPAPGRIALWVPPDGEGVRTDAGVQTGSTVSSHYDPLLAKIICHGPDRASALRRARRALGKTVCLGVHTNRGFAARILADADFAGGAFSTGFVAARADLTQEPKRTTEELALGFLLHYRHATEAAIRRAISVSNELRDWASGGTLDARLVLHDGGDEATAHVRALGGDGYAVDIDAQEPVTLHLTTLDETRFGAQTDTGALAGSYVFDAAGKGYFDFGAHVLELARAERLDGAAKSGDGQVVAPMHGRIVELCVDEGARVQVGSRLLVIEAMKMQHEVRAAIAGAVTQMFCAPDAQVSDGQRLLTIEPAEKV